MTFTSCLHSISIHKTQPTKFNLYHGKPDGKGLFVSSLEMFHALFMKLDHFKMATTDIWSSSTKTIHNVCLQEIRKGMDQTWANSKARRTTTVSFVNLDYGNRNVCLFETISLFILLIHAVDEWEHTPISSVPWDSNKI